MSLRSLLAKDWAVEVNTAAANATPVWTPIKGLTSISETLDSNMEDDADFDGDGWGSSVKTQITWSLDCEGRRKRVTENSTFTPDAGQEFVRKAGRIVGFDANVMVRWYRKDGAPDAYTGYATVDYGGGGGGVTDLEPFNFTLNGQGKPTDISNPMNAAPSLTSVNPTGGTTAGGTSVTLTGTGFTGATAVAFGATAATSFTVNSDTSITAVSPARAAGAVQVTATTPRGTSNGVTYTYS